MGQDNFAHRQTHKSKNIIFVSVHLADIIEPFYLPCCGLAACVGGAADMVFNTRDHTCITSTQQTLQARSADGIVGIFQLLYIAPIYTRTAHGYLYILHCLQ